MISQHWFRWWLGAVRQRAIIWANVDPDHSRHMASLGHNELLIQELLSDRTKHPLAVIIREEMMEPWDFNSRRVLDWERILCDKSWFRCCSKRQQQVSFQHLPNSSRILAVGLSKQMAAARELVRPKADRKSGCISLHDPIRYRYHLIPIQGIEMTNSKRYSKSILISGIWEKSNNNIIKYHPANHEIPVYSNKMKKFDMWILPWQALWQLPLHIITAQAVAVGCVWCSWWQFSTFQCRIASLWMIWLRGYRDMDRIDIGIEMWYKYWYRYRKICNDMQP